MKIIPLKIRLLSPLFNYAHTTTGGALTSSFIGDLALTYALNDALKIKNFAEIYLDERQKKPYYRELKDLDFLFSVGRPLSMERTPMYIRQTSFGCDGGLNMDIMSKGVMKTPYKNYFRVQGIKPDAEFSTLLICKNSFNLPLPFTIRLGTGRECLALLELDTDFKNLQKRNEEECWLNAFTLKEIFGNDVFTRYLGLKHYHIDYQLEHYILLKKMTTEKVKTIFENQF